MLENPIEENGTSQFVLSAKDNQATEMYVSSTCITTLLMSVLGHLPACKAILSLIIIVLIQSGPIDLPAWSFTMLFLTQSAEMDPGKRGAN